MEICPYHNIEPTVEEFVARRDIDTTYIDNDGQTKHYTLPKLVIYKLYCPKCREQMSDAGAGRFGTGYSARSLETATRRWDNACANEKLKIFKNAIKTGS